MMLQPSYNTILNAIENRLVKLVTAEAIKAALK